jgi:hypothetical protein
MFMTFEHSEVPIGALIQGAHLWRYAEYVSRQPWFYVSALEKVDDGYRCATLMLKELDDLIDLQLAESQGWRIAEVYLVSSEALNNSGQWKLDKLLEVRQLTTNAGKTLIYRLSAGNEYCEHPSLRDKKILHSQMIFSTNATSEHEQA